MKKVVTIFRFVLIAALPMMVSCSKSYNSSSNPSTNPDFQASLVQGTWAMDSFTQKSEDKSSQFAGTVFTFSKDGKLTATQNGSTITGTWAYAPSAVGYYGGPASSASMNINLGTQSPFSRLTKTWNVEAATSTSLALVNPEPNEDEHVKFSHK